MAATTIISNGNGKEVRITKPSAKILKEFPFVKWSVQLCTRDSNNDSRKLKKNIRHFIDFEQAQIFASSSLL